MADHTVALKGYVNWSTYSIGKAEFWNCSALRRLPLTTPEHLGSNYKFEKTSLSNEFKPGWRRGGRAETQVPAMTQKEENNLEANYLDPDHEMDASMRFRRTVYEREDWIRHRSSTRHIRHILSIASSRVIRSLAPPVLSLTFIATVVAAFNEAVLVHNFPSWVPLLHVPSLPFQLTAPALALLLVFRTNASYARFDEAWKAWGSNVNRSRDFSRQSLTWIRHPADSEKLNSLLRYCIAFPFCMKSHLTREGGLKGELTSLLEQNELDVLLEYSHKPNYILQTMSEIIYNCNLSDMERALLDRNITQFHDNLGTCERILKTPIPLSYTRLTSRFLVIWHATLPFALWDQCSWVVIPAIFCSAGALFCIEEMIPKIIPRGLTVELEFCTLFAKYNFCELFQVGVVIEEPLSMLPLDHICRTIHQDVEGLVQAHADSLIWSKKLTRKDENLGISNVNGLFKQGQESSNQESRHNL